MHVAMPESLLLGGQGGEYLGADDVFDPDQAGITLIAVQDDTLHDVLIQGRTVVVGLDLTLHIPRIEMESTDVGMDGVQGFLVLQCRGTCLEDSGFRRRLFTRGRMGAIGTSATDNGRPWISPSAEREQEKHTTHMSGRWRVAFRELRSGSWSALFVQLCCDTIQAGNGIGPDLLRASAAIPP